MIISYNNTDIFYTSKGTGNPIVFLHGFLESSKIWAPFLPQLAATRQVITIDLPGHGKSGNLDQIHSMELMAQVVKVVLEHLDTKKATLIGHSMGGYVSLAFLEKFPDAVAGIVLMNSTPEADSHERINNRNRAIKLIQKNKEAFVSMAISNLLSKENNKVFKNEIDVLKAEALGFSTEGIIAALEGMKIRTTRIDVLKDFNRTKYSIIGKNDPVMDSNIAYNIAMTCGCSIFLTENGHLSFLEDFKKIQEIIHLID